jgi:hypothetical protein
MLVLMLMTVLAHGLPSSNFSNARLPPRITSIQSHHQIPPHGPVPTTLLPSLHLVILHPIASVPSHIAAMASKTTIDASALSKPKPSTSAPISPLPTDIARLYTYAHPAIILSLYAFQFKSIVADPVPALLNILAPLAVLQVTYVAICLPPTGETPKVKKVKPGEKKAVKEVGGARGSVVVRVKVSIFSFSGHTWL